MSLFTLVMLLGSTLLAMSLLGTGPSSTHAQSAGGITFQDFYIPSSNDPWGTAFDSNGNVWLAIPGCDPSPMCSSGTPPGKIAEFNPATSTWIATYQLPSGYAQPLFLAFDAQGRLWFAMPMDNAIGMFNPSTKTFQQWAVPTTSAGPWDVAVDHQGMIWFTEHYVNKIGRFDPGTQTFLEVATPASNSQPYGIVVDASNNIWFTENNSSVALIGEYTSTGRLQEYKIRSSVQNGLTPHLITVDPNGNIWWSEGWVSMIGELKVGLAVPGTTNGVSEYAYPRACSTCGTHTSGIGVDRNGLIWFDDSGQEIFGSFPDSGSGSFTTYSELARNAHPNDGLNVDAQNRVWFDEEFANKLGEAVQNNVPSATPTLPPQPTSPVSKLWYLAEGRVGGGFTEWLTLGNPTASACAVSVQYLYQPDHGTSQVKTLSQTLPAYQRATRNVNADLGTSASGAGITDAAIVTAAGCAGIVVERPMYFRALGVTSGDDTLGATHLGTTFYFADLAVGAQAGGGSSASFLAILNPPGGATATVTATYYANGQPVGSQQVNVPAGTRGTLFPATATPRLPSHVVVALTSTQPVLIERPTYFSGIHAGNAGIVSGAGDIAGVQNPSTDWLFAEGYTGGQFQENVALANLNTTAARVTITLEYPTGATRPFTLTVNPKSQVIWNVNAANAGGPSQEVSAEISSTGASIIAERELYFSYAHAANGRTLSAIGGTDVLGMVAPAASAFSFAEGYTNGGYDEWLTVQNPTGSAEAISITLANAKGVTYTSVVTVGAHSRYTQDIVATVLHHLYHQGDGYLGWEVSMAVQSKSGVFVAERPMYWNASGTQGGSDAFGYTGG